MQYANSARANVWEHLTYSTPKSVLKRLPKFLVTSTVGPATDTTRMVGTLFIGSAGIQGTASQAVVFGELYVTYRVRFYNPQPTTGSSVTFATTSSDTTFPWDPSFTTVTGNIPAGLSTNTNTANLPINGYVSVSRGGPIRITALYYGNAIGVDINPDIAVRDSAGNDVPVTTVSSNTLVDSVTGDFSINSVYHVEQTPIPAFILSRAFSTGTPALSSGLLLVSQDNSNQNNNVQVALPFNVSSGLPKWEDSKFERQITKTDIQKYIEDSLKNITLKDKSGKIVHDPDSPVVVKMPYGNLGVKMPIDHLFRNRLP
jgi:hypothetical protein